MAALNGIVYERAIPLLGLDPMTFYDELRALYEADAWPEFRITLIDPTYIHRVRRQIDIQSNGRTMGQIFRRDVFPQIMESSDTVVWRPGWRIVVQIPTRRGYSRAELTQLYRDGEASHCVLSPIRLYFEHRADTCDGEATQQKCRLALSRVAALERTYSKGVPASALEFVATRLGVRIRISDPFGENEERYNDRCLRGKIFSYRNTRFNHVEEIVCDTEVMRMTVPQLMSTLSDLRTRRRFYMYKQTSATRVPTRIDCEDGRFVLDDEDAVIFQAARDKYSLDGYAVDAQKEPALAKFLGDGLRVTSHAQFHVGEELDDIEEYNVLDLSAAYTRGSSCGAYFQGYLVGVSDVRLVEGGIDHLRAHPGIYSVHDIDLGGCAERVHDYATQLHLRAGASLILPSPELLWWWDHGVRFNVRAGAYGVVLPDIDWEGCRLLEKGPGPLHAGISRYKVWCGQLGYSNNGRKSVYLPGDARWAAVLAEKGYRTAFYAGDGDICVHLPAQRTPELKHTFAFVTSYTRINVLNKLLEFDPQDVRGVMLDAIVYVGPCPAGAAASLWVEKPTVHRDVLTEYGKDGWYGTSGIWAGEYTDAFITAPPSRVKDPLCFLEGAGGSGKSHSVLADAGFRDVLFAAPTWSLVCFMMRKYRVAGTTVHRLAGSWRDVDDEGNVVMSRCRPYHEEHRRYPAVVFVDEATMVDKEMLEKIVEIYKGRSRIILAGDIKVTGIPATSPPVWFQCRNRTRVYDPRASECAVVTYETDYRASGELVEKKRQLREAMLEVFLSSTAEDPGDDSIDAYVLHERARTLFASQLCTAATCQAEYVKGDTILAGTHELADDWGEKLKDRDCRYRVTSHSAADVAAAQRGEDVSLTGDIVDDKGSRAAVFALAFTIHSFQGKTFTGGTLWIDARRAWDYAMLYTAISRCQTISQIRLFFE